MTTGIIHWRICSPPAESLTASRRLTAPGGACDKSTVTVPCALSMLIQEGRAAPSGRVTLTAAAPVACWPMPKAKDTRWGSSTARESLFCGLTSTLPAGAGGKAVEVAETGQDFVSLEVVGEMGGGETGVFASGRVM